ncbi:putative membrane protein affecting hemolysin expression [Kineosporia succinea]|uniref:Membrane protein affecting hemolysin expression n=1 Tax=Kineosporia succinea TaxID=84632 RepID=A0ABT9P558_9ACTN|nr:putative membrane protein affecting hemolysin expression [Kineosporia succinea]
MLSLSWREVLVLILVVGVLASVTYLRGRYGRRR